MQLLKLGKVAEISLEIENSKDIVRFLDMALILMEGGNEEDFNLLDAPEPVVESSEKADGEVTKDDSAEKTEP